MVGILFRAVMLKRVSNTDGLLSLRPNGGLLVLQGCWLGLGLWWLMRWWWWLWWSFHSDTDEVRSWDHRLCFIPHCWSVAEKNKKTMFTFSVFRTFIGEQETNQSTQTHYSMHENDFYEAQVIRTSRAIKCDWRQRYCVLNLRLVIMYKQSFSCLTWVT